MEGFILMAPLPTWQIHRDTWALLLQALVLVSMATASPGQADEPLIYSTKPKEGLTEEPERTDSASALLASGVLGIRPGSIPGPAKFTGSLPPGTAGNRVLDHNPSMVPMNPQAEPQESSATTLPQNTNSSDQKASTKVGSRDNGNPKSTQSSSTYGGDSSPPPYGSNPALGDVPQGIHQLLRPPEELAPSYVTLARPQVMFIPPKPTMVAPEEIFPSSTAEYDWGSGDYWSMSFFGPEGDDFPLVTSLPTDSSDMEEMSTEVYDTSFPTRIVPSLSSLHILSAFSFSTSNHNYELNPTSVHPSHPHATAVLSVTRQNNLSDDSLEMDWPDVYNIATTEILLPDMNSLEYYTNLLAKENSTSVEQGGNSTSTESLPDENINTVHIAQTTTFTIKPTTTNNIDLQSSDNTSWIEESSADGSGIEPILNTTLQVDLNVSEPSIVLTPSMSLSASLWISPTPPVEKENVSTLLSSAVDSVQPTATMMPSSNISSTDVHSTSFNSTEDFLHSTSTVTSPTVPPIDPTLNTTVIVSSEATTAESANPEVTTLDQGIPPEVPGTSSPSFPQTTTSSPPVTTFRPPQTTAARSYLCNITKPDMYLVRVGLPTGSTVGYARSHIRDVLKSEFNRSVELQIVKAPPEFIFRVVSGPLVYTAVSVINALRLSPRTSPNVLSASTVYPVPETQFLVHSVLQFIPRHVDVRVCNFSERIERGLTMAYAEVRRRTLEPSNIYVDIVNITMSSVNVAAQQKTPVDITFAVRDTSRYLRGAEVSSHLRLLNMVEFSFYVGFPVLQIAEPFHYPELNVTHLLRSSWVRSVLLGVLDERVSERIFQAKMERRLAQLLGEVLGVTKRWKRATSVGNSSVQIVRTSWLEGPDTPLEMVYFVESLSGERLPAAATTGMLNRVDIQRAAIVLGYRVRSPLAEPMEKLVDSPSETQNNNMWIIVGVVVPVAVVIIIIIILYWKLCRSDKLEFQPDAMSTIQQRQKSPAMKESSLPVLCRKNIESSEEDEEEEEEEEDVTKGDETSDEEEEEGVEMDTQRPDKKQINRTEVNMFVGGLKRRTTVLKKAEDVKEREKERQNDKKERKLCRVEVEDKKAGVQEKGYLEKRKELQTPSVKGFDFAKLHLGQHSKEDIMVIQEPVPQLGPVKEATPSENGEPPTPKSKTSSTKASRATRRRGRISPTDGDSLASEPSSARESTEETLKAPATPNEAKQQRKPRNGAPNSLDEQLSSASIFEHVDRMSRSADGTRRVSNKIQLIAMQPMPALAPHSPAVTERVPDGAQVNKEIQVALRHKSEIEHHRNKIRLRAKRKGHYDFPAMDDIMDSFGDPKDQQHIYQKAQMQIDKILDPDSHVAPAVIENKKSARGRRSPKQKKKQQANGSLTDADKDRLITTDSDGTYKKYPGVNNVAYVSDPDQPADGQTPSPTDDVFADPGCSPPRPYVPPQPSIEEARQQMHSLLDDAFALVSPSSQGSTAGITLPGLSPGVPRAAQWASSHSGTPALSPYSPRYTDTGGSPPVQSLIQRQGLGSDYLPSEEPVQEEQLQSDTLYSNRGHYSEEMPSSARPRPVGGTTGAQLHHLTQVGLSSRIGAYPGAGRISASQSGSGWGHYHSEEEYNRAVPSRDQVLGYTEYSSSALQMPRNPLREPSAPPAHLETSMSCYSSAHIEETSPPTHSSASLIKAIREELMRLSQKQAAVSTYHS